VDVGEGEGRQQVPPDIYPVSRWDSARRWPPRLILRPHGVSTEDLSSLIWPSRNSTYSCNPYDFRRRTVRGWVIARPARVVRRGVRNVGKDTRINGDLCYGRPFANQRMTPDISGDWVVGSVG